LHLGGGTGEVPIKHVPVGVPPFLHSACPRIPDAAPGDISATNMGYHLLSCVRSISSCSLLDEAFSSYKELNEDFLLTISRITDYIYNFYC